MNLKELFEKKRKYINFFFEHLNVDKANQILKILNNCKNNIIFTGVGKSAIIANKIALTMLSTGTKALFVPATEALHGDIAIVTKEDVFVILSKSGETEELLNLIPYVKKRQSKIIGVVSNENSRLTKMVDYFINLPLKKELCPYNLAPTTSTSIQLIFGDVLTIALMQKKNFSIKEYALNHPSGAIGKQITLTVEDLMLKQEKLPLCFEDQKIKNVLHILSSKKCGCLLVIDKKKKLKGIFTDGDLRRLVENNNLDFFNKKLKDIMIKNPILINKQSLAIEAVKKMESQKQITVLPVVDNQQIVGLIRMHDIIQTGLSSLLL